MAGYLGATPVPQATQHRESFTATSGQTTFASAGYTPQFLDVFLNGSHLSPADFVATNGSDVVLVVAASADDICDIISYSPFEVANPVFTGSATFNEGSADADFRVETNANANAFIIDGGNNTITADSQLIAGLARSNTAGACAFIVDPNDTTVTYGFRIDAATNSFNIDRANSAVNLMSFDANHNVIIANSGGTLSTATAGTSNFRAGVNAGNSIVSGANENVLIGDEAGTALVSGGINNTAVGFSALATEDAHGSNTAIGWSALKNLNAGATGKNTAVGADAGRGMNTGVDNTVVGFEAGHDISSGGSNTFVGANAGDKTDDGAQNTAVGQGALHANCGDINTAVGQRALFFTTGAKNTAVGGDALFGCIGGVQNTAVGYLALAGEAGNNNAAVGIEALKVCTGNDNTAMGKNAGNAVTSGTNNLFLGKDAGLSGSPGGVINTGDHRIVLGDENITDANVQVDWTVASDQRDKTDFTDLDLGLDFVKALAPVTYKWDKRSKYGDKTADGYDLNDQTPDGTHKEDWLDIGFKAQEVQALEDAAGYTTAAKKNLTVSTSDDGKQMGLQYSKFVPILVKAIQEQNALIVALTARVATLEG